MKRFLFKQLILFLLSVVIISCGMDVPKDIPTSFETLTISKSDIVIPLHYSAKLKGTADVTIMPQVSGQLVKVCVTEGQQVKKGDVLFVIDQRNAQLELEAAEANLQAALASESSAKLEYESNKNLFDKNIVSHYMLENSENAYKRAQATVAQARATVDRARVNLGFCTISSPVTGYIGSIPVYAGDQVSPSTYLTMVSGNANMYAEFSINESLLEQRVTSDKRTLEEFPDVIFIMKNGTEYPLKGRITSVTGTVDRSTGTVACKATFPNPDGVLYSGIQGTVVIPIEKNDVMVVPQNAIVKLQDKSLVYTVGADSCAHSAIITSASIDNGKDAVILSGLEPGDVIVTEGANNVQEGQQVLFPAVENKK